MRHIVLTEDWKWGTEPFPSYRCDLVYGRNKFGHGFLPVQGVAPVTTWTAMGASTGIGRGDLPLYVGPSKAAADAAHAAYLASPDRPAWQTGWVKGGFPTLPEGKFRVIKTREKGTILVVEGEDSTNRCLLFASHRGGFRGGVGLVGDSTTASVLKAVSASNACDSGVAVVALMEPGSCVVFHSYGRRNDDYTRLTWNGLSIDSAEFTAAEWRVEKVPVHDDEMDVL